MFHLHKDPLVRICKEGVPGEWLIAYEAFESLAHHQGWKCLSHQQILKLTLIKNLQKQAGLAGWLVNQSPWGSDINGTFTCKYSKSQARWSMILWPPKQNDDPNRTNLPDPERPPCSLWLLRVWLVRHHNFGKIPPEPSFDKEKIISHISPQSAIENQDFRKSQSKMLFLVR